MPRVTALAAVPAAVQVRPVPHSQKKPRNSQEQTPPTTAKPGACPTAGQLCYVYQEFTTSCCPPLGCYGNDGTATCSQKPTRTYTATSVGTTCAQTGQPCQYANGDYTNCCSDKSLECAEIYQALTTTMADTTAGTETETETRTETGTSTTPTTAVSAGHSSAAQRGITSAIRGATDYSVQWAAPFWVTTSGIR